MSNPETLDEWARICLGGEPIVDKISAEQMLAFRKKQLAEFGWWVVRNVEIDDPYCSVTTESAERILGPEPDAGGEWE